MTHRHLPRAVWFACLLPALSVSFMASAADVPVVVPAAVSKRPKICLVLSGGGARGAAHVGVIKVLEEYRIPIDCIAGTSMGALVGGAYASGMTVPEMERLNAGISVDLLFKDTPPRRDLAMRRKVDDYGIFIGPELGIEDGSVRLAKGAVSGVQLETVLRRLSRVKGFQKFDELPIPFRAIATDLVTGKAVVFDEGELADVMRASMSVPGAVAPAETGGMMLVDGMLTRNLPVEEARAMGADIIIAVNVGTPLLKREELNGILGVTSQMLSILTEQNVQASIATLRPGDILIEPELGDFSTGAFDDLTKIIPLGEVAARKVAARLANLSVPAEEYAALRVQQTQAIAAETRPIDEIVYGAMSRVNPEVLRLTMQTKPGNPVDQVVLDADMRRIYGLGNFEHVGYRFIEEQGKRILVVDAVEKSSGLDALRVGLGLSTDFSGDAFFNLAGSYRRYWVNSLGAEWRTDLQIGRASILRSEFFQPLSAGGAFFVAPQVSVSRRTANLYQGNNRVATYDSVGKVAELDVGAQFARYGQVRLGVLTGALDNRLATGPQSLSPGASNVSQGAFVARLLLDQADSVHFPRSGWRVSTNLYKSTNSLGADDGYTRWDADGSVAHSFGEHTFNLAVKAGGANGSSPLPRYDMFQWGGFLQQSGYRTGQLYGQSLSYGRLMYYRRVLKGSLFEGAYAGLSLEIGKVGRPLVPGNPDGLLKSASIFFAADSPLGPAYLAYGRAADGNSSFYFFLGRPF